MVRRREHQRALRLRLIPKAIAVVCAFSGMPQASAIEITSNPRARAHGGVDVLYVQSASLDRDARLSWNGGYQRYAFKYLLFGGSLFLAPDTGRNSGDVSIYQHYYVAHPMVGVAYPALFRWTASLGPTFVWESIKYVALGEEETLSDQDYGMMARLGIDYAFGNTFEASLGFGFQDRFRAEKRDLFYGFSFAVNLL